jgi:hypothetical protein
MSAQWPRVYSWLLVNVPTFTGWSGVPVYDSYPVTDDSPTDYLTVGYTGPADPHGGNYSTTQAPDGFRWIEQGNVRCHLACQSGDTDPVAVRTRAFALADAFEASIRGDRTLGGTLSPDSTVDVSVDVQPAQNANGSAQSLFITVQYRTVT